MHQLMLPKLVSVSSSLVHHGAVWVAIIVVPIVNPWSGVCLCVGSKGIRRGSMFIALRTVPDASKICH